VKGGARRRGAPGGAGGRREGELPVGKAEPPGHLLADPERVLAGEHQRDPVPRLLRDRTHRRLGRVPRHRAGVAQAEVDVLVTVDVVEARAAGVGCENGEAAGPPDHPVHRHAAEQ
jgi:hypothetical protein